jgi:hypothetical protein
MQKSIRTELLSHVIDTLEAHDAEVLATHGIHNLAFNQDYYVIGYVQGEKWLEEHKIGAFEAIAEVQSMQEKAYGAAQPHPSQLNAESIVNQLAYFWGEELLEGYDLGQDTDTLVLIIRNDFDALDDEELAEQTALLHKRYGIGFIDGKGSHIRRTDLTPMTHHEACTFKCKMTEPAKYFIYEVGS